MQATQAQLDSVLQRISAETDPTVRATLQAKSHALSNQIFNLSIQSMDLIDELQDAQASLQAAQSQVQIAASRIAELQSKLNQLKQCQCLSPSQQLELEKLQQSIDSLPSN